MLLFAGPVALPAVLLLRRPVSGPRLAGEAFVVTRDRAGSDRTRLAGELTAVTKGRAGTTDRELGHRNAPAHGRALSHPTTAARKPKEKNPSFQGGDAALRRRQ